MRSGIIIVVLLLMLSLLAACGGDVAAPTTASTSTPTLPSAITPSPTPTTAPPTPITTISPTAAPTATLTPTATIPTPSQQVLRLSPAKDNTIYEDHTKEVSNGKGEHLFVGKNGRGETRRTPVAFDLSSLPKGAKVTSVELVLNVSRAQNSPSTAVQLHRLLADWGEGTSNADANEGGGADATPGDASWHYRKFNTNLWQTLGGEFASTSSASMSVGNAGKFTWGSTAQMVADVQSWVDNSAGNFGWILLGDESRASTAKRFDSRENSIADNRPVLVVTYTP